MPFRPLMYSETIHCRPWSWYERRLPPSRMVGCSSTGSTLECTRFMYRFWPESRFSSTSSPSRCCCWRSCCSLNCIRRFMSWSSSSYWPMVAARWSATLMPRSSKRPSVFSKSIEMREFLASLAILMYSSMLSVRRASTLALASRIFFLRSFECQLSVWSQRCRRALRMSEEWNFLWLSRCETRSCKNCLRLCSTRSFAWCSARDRSKASCRFLRSSAAIRCASAILARC
mmetsp:Transcript_1037/g.2372  ORF Transcript_1037/g.2372 Transcript_1037/m.2372 type:complete len:230 (-) Transcript_1037:105-794(-)